MPTDQDKLGDVRELTETCERWLSSEDIERAHIARILNGANKMLRELAVEKKSEDKILNGLIIALNGIKDIEKQRPKKYILEMKKRIIKDIHYLGGGNESIR